jgi:hypothetical protein
MFLRVSPSVVNMLGFEPEEVQGRLAMDFIHPLDLGITRNEMRLIRRTGRPRHFYSRYINKASKPVELIWTGGWFKDKAEYVFVGRRPRGAEKLPLTHRLDLLDGYQISKGLFAVSLVSAWAADIGGFSMAEINNIIVEHDGDVAAFIAFLLTYAVATFTCVVWKHKLFQFIISLISIVMWIWMGFVTLLSPKYIAAAGIYEVMLGVGSIFVLYFRGRQL